MHYPNIPYRPVLFRVFAHWQPVLPSAAAADEEVHVRAVQEHDGQSHGLQ